MMMSDKSGRFLVDWRDEGVRHRKVFATAEAARRYMVAREKEEVSRERDGE